MAYEPLAPLPFLPIIGRFDLNTFIPGSSDYEIMARVIETYNKAVELFNQIISQYSDIDKTIEELTKEYQKQLDEYKTDTDQHISAFEQEVNTKTQAQDNKIAELAATVRKLQNDVDDLINGEYIDNYVKALATWIDNNLQQLVAKVVKYVWFEINESGYFVAYIPDTWDFVDFGTELDPDNEDYGKLVLEWEPEVPDDPAFQSIPIIPDYETLNMYYPEKNTALNGMNGTLSTDILAIITFNANESIAWKPISLTFKAKIEFLGSETTAHFHAESVLIKNLHEDADIEPIEQYNTIDGTINSNELDDKGFYTFTYNFGEASFVRIKDDTYMLGFEFDISGAKVSDSNYTSTNKEINIYGLEGVFTVQKKEL
jgi:hypothetical protein